MTRIMASATDEMKGAERIDPDDVNFNADVIAAAWEAFDDGMPAVAAAAFVNELENDVTVCANDGIEVDRDVEFRDAGILVEERAMGVCAEETARKHAGAFVPLDRDDGKVLALTRFHIYDL